MPTVKKDPVWHVLEVVRWTFEYHLGAKPIDDPRPFDEHAKISITCRTIEPKKRRGREVIVDVHLNRALSLASPPAALRIGVAADYGSHHVINVPYDAGFLLLHGLRTEAIKCLNIETLKGARANLANIRSFEAASRIEEFE